MNRIEGSSKFTIIASGISYNYVIEAVKKYNFDVEILKLSQIYPLPEKILEKALENTERILVIEERDPFVEEEVIKYIKKIDSNLPIFGTLTGHIPRECGLDTNLVALAISDFLGKVAEEVLRSNNVPSRFGSLCKGCPHKSSYNVIKKVLSNYPDSVLVGDRGCYNRVAAPPESILDVCMNMGSSVGIVKGIVVSTSSKVVAVMGAFTFWPRCKKT